MKLKKLSEVKLHTMTSIYGLPGSGKSSKINSLPGNVLIIDTDKGLASVAQDERFSVAECSSWEDVLEAMTYAKDFDSIAIDHFTNVQELCLDSLAGKGKKRGINNYGDATNLLKNLINDLVDLAYEGKNILVIAQERVRDPEEGDEFGTRVVSFDLMPTLASYLQANSRIVAHCERNLASKIMNGKKVTKELYQVRFADDPYLVLKVTRKPGLEVPKLLTNPTWQDIVGLTTGETQEKLKPKKESK